MYIVCDFEVFYYLDSVIGFYSATIEINWYHSEEAHNI